MICFVRGTRVKTPEGDKRIEDLTVGDQVWSRDPATGATGFKAVVNTFVSESSTIYVLRYGDDEEVRGTGEHPFWILEYGAFVRLRDIVAGQTLLLDEQRTAVVTAIDIEHLPVGEAVQTYNIEVEGWHTYFVSPHTEGDDDDGYVWVHNRCYGTGRLRAALGAA